MTLETIQHQIADIKQRLSGTPDFGPELMVEVSGNQVNVYHPKYPNTSATIDIESNTVIATSGSRFEDSRQDLNEMLNCHQGGFLRNAKYIIDGGAFKFYTDAYGRVRRAGARLSSEIDIQHGGRPKYSPGRDKLAVDEYSHIIGCSLMGPQESINIVYLHWNTNRELMRPIETFLSAPIRAKEHYRLTLNSRINYSASSSRPESIVYWAELESAEVSGTFKFTFQNPSEQ